MTDEVNALTVVLDAEYRVDNVEAVVNAIRMIKGVYSVNCRITDINDHVAQQRVQQKLREKMVALWEETFK